MDIPAVHIKQPTKLTTKPSGRNSKSLLLFVRVALSVR